MNKCGDCIFIYKIASCKHNIYPLVHFVGFLGENLPGFNKGFFFSFGSYTLWKRVLKIHVVAFFLKSFFSIFTHTHFTTRVDKWGRLEGGKFPMLVYLYTKKLDTGIFTPIYYVLIFGDSCMFIETFCKYLI